VRLVTTPGISGRLGLRARLTVAFAIGGLLLSGAITTATYELAQHYLLGQRATSAARQAYVNARLVRSGLETAKPDVSGLLASLQTPTTSSSVIEYHGGWFASSVAVDRAELPGNLRGLVESGAAGQQRFMTTSGTDLAIGIPLPAVGARYFEVFDLSDLRQTLSTLLTALAFAAAATTVAGGLGGLWASRRVLRPLSTAANAAAEIADGRLDTRLPPNRDRDLEVLTASFNAMAGSLAERVKRDARFASDVSHELRSPLTTLATSVEVLEGQRDSMSERAQQALTLLGGDVNRFRQVVEDLLEISRADSGVPDNAEAVNVAELIVHTLGAAHVADIPLHVDAGVSSCMVLVDKRRLDRSIINLVDNARLYAGGVTDIHVVALAGTVRVMVDDAGAGIPVEERERIFGRFARGAAAHRAPGSSAGLGLAIVAEHTRRNGGRTWVEPSPRGGARFVIELPRYVPA
jgi:two-component system sensor histidine kinase MtrB